MQPAYSPSNYETALANVKRAVALGIIDARYARWCYMNIEMTRYAPMQVIYQFYPGGKKI
jgi:hypothetical protein